MQCQNCGQPATQHFTKIVQGKKHVTNLCAACAEQQSLIKDGELNLPAILHSVIGQQVGPTSEELARLTCPTCGIKYMQFKAEGRLGCPNDYKVFQTALEPLLDRIHRSRRHVGKIPPHATENADKQRDLMALRLELKKAVEREAYEEAARLRDQIRTKEAS